MINLDIKKIKNMLFWFLKELPLFILPFAVSQLVLWIVVSRFIRIKKFTDKTVVAFTSIYYNGNPKAVFEYMKKLDKYECYWIARNIRSLRYLRKNKSRAIYAFFPIISMRYLLNTDVLVTSDTALQSLFFHKKPRFVQLWHGIGPKAISHSQEEYAIYDAWCVASDFSKERHIELWNAPQEKLFVTGFPRMDTLYKHMENSKKKLINEIGIKNDRRIIFYAPTFDVGLWPWGDEYKEFEKLCRFCKENDLILILRLHPFAKINRTYLKKIIKKYENVYWLDMSKEPDTMKILAITDILVTDWSSIYTEYFLTKRPIIYLEVNMKYFTKLRGEPEIPPGFRAGEIVNNNDEFFESLRIVLKKGNRFRKEQERLLKIIHGDVDGKASERVTRVIEKLIEKE